MSPEVEKSSGRKKIQYVLQKPIKYRKRNGFVEFFIYKIPGAMLKTFKIIQRNRKKRMCELN